MDGASHTDALRLTTAWLSDGRVLSCTTGLRAMADIDQPVSCCFLFTLVSKSVAFLVFVTATFVGFLSMFGTRKH
jgi:hypothetical protein